MIARNHPVWEKLIKGQSNHKFTNASASLLFFNLSMDYKRDPGKLPELVDKAYAFFCKYETILTAEMSTLAR